MSIRNGTGSKHQRGQSLLEFALVLPFLIALIMGIFDLGFAVYAYNTVASSAREGARVGMIAGASSTNIKDQVMAVTQGLSINRDSDIVIGYFTEDGGGGSNDSGNVVRVTVNYHWTPATPYIGRILGNGSITIASSASMYIE